MFFWEIVFPILWCLLQLKMVVTKKTLFNFRKIKLFTKKNNKIKLFLDVFDLKICFGNV
jgi:hypothetical protein